MDKKATSENNDGAFVESLARIQTDALIMRNFVSNNVRKLIAIFLTKIANVI